MKKLQESLLSKAAAVLLMLALIFTGAIFGLKALQAVPYLDCDSYQETAEFYRLRREFEDQIASAFALEQQLAVKDLTYVERQQLTQELEQMKEGLDASATNFRFLVCNDAGEDIAFNLNAGEELPSPVYYARFTLGEHYAEELDQAGYEIIYYDQVQNELFYIPSPTESDSGTEITVKASADPVTYTIECAVVPEEQLLESGVEDALYQLALKYHTATSTFSTWVTVAGSCLVLAAACILFLLWTAGHKAGTEEIVLTWQENIFFDLYLSAMLVAGTAIFAGAWWLLGYYYFSCVEQQGQEGAWLPMSIAALCALFSAVIALTLRTLVVRLKGHALARTTLLCRISLWLWRGLGKAVGWGMELVRSLPFLWRTVAGFLVYFLANAALFNEARYNGLAGAIWWLLHIAVLLLLCWWAMSFRKLRKGSQAIAAGNLSYQIDTHHMPHDLRCHAEDLNNISKGMAEAVDEQMKSERFKAELITNVSHDLKTPLTSIINYVDLLKTTQQEDPRAQEYIEVLDRKSQRLKKLTEDLVEASKASTGVLSVNREKIGMSQLMDQALGEWQEKLEARKLTLVTSLPEGETWVYADGRHLWRVLDNLLSNCAKYAMEGTRVYLDLTRGHGQVSFSVKNISREPLNVPPERLMERFVRGDESRTTEGSGLGLSIARSLTELQGGTFELAVDGDLFKAIVTLPQAN